ncbi:MAG: flagellar export chaperone FliS [Peptococcaceae bacterium]|nr:flagellar export chaperone FliS [Peptococcaceae bacterium]
MQAPNPYQQYKANAVMTADPGKLTLMLYTGAVKNIKEAIEHVHNNKPAAAHKAITKAQDIVEYLASTLNPAIEISRNLAQLYDYMYRRLVEANVKKDAAILQEVADMLNELRETWQEAAKSVKNRQD